VKTPAVLADVAGTVSIEQGNDTKIIKIKHQAVGHDRYDLPKGRSKKKAETLVKDGDMVKAGDILMKIGDSVEVLAKTDGKVRITDGVVYVHFDHETHTQYEAPGNFMLLVREGDLVTPGTPLSEGSINLQELFALKGRMEAQKYVIKEIQFIYSSQGQNLNDKHIEVIVRQMFSRAYVRTSGDSELVAGEIVDRMVAETAVAQTKKSKPEIEQLLLGVTKASLTTESWLSAASFQETARVLIDAAVSGKIDPLRGLKENVIIGKPIPAGTGFETRQKEIEELETELAKS
jgi:DNA-directed RNA polymerase subunit beta'